MPQTKREEMLSAEMRRVIESDLESWFDTDEEMLHEEWDEDLFDEFSDLPVVEKIRRPYGKEKF